MLEIQAPPPQFRATLHVSDSSVVEGEAVRFRAELSPGDADAEFQFHFGDEEASTWTRTSVITSFYGSAGSYGAFVAARKDGRAIAESPMTTIRVSPPERFTVSLEADRDFGLINEDIRFTAVLDPPSPDIKYVFSFGDRLVETTRESAIEHRYAREGMYRAIVTAHSQDGRSGESTPVTVKIAAKRDAIGQVRLSLAAIPPRAKKGMDVTFRVEAGARKGVEYRFIFGDGEALEWARQTDVSHRYRDPGTYHAYAEARVGQQVVGESNPVVVEIEEDKEPSGIPWPKILIGSILASACYLISRSQLSDF